ncbi:MAG: TolC family protein [Acidobacteria bacterium]|nr:TolC family protein [Acidobacteriota bacterium]
MSARGLVIALAALAAWQPAYGQAPGASNRPAWTLAELERLALDNNPTTRAAQAARDAAAARARQAGMWPNPIAGYTGEEITRRGAVDPRGEHGFFVEQTIVLGGKLRLSGEVFERAVDEAEARIDLQRQRILTSVRSLYYQLLTAERRVDIYDRLAALGSEAVGVTAQLFNVGAADRPDFLEMEIEARRVQLELNAARNDAFALRQRLASVVGVPEVANGQFAGAIADAIPELEREVTIRALVERSPQIRAARAVVARAQAVTARARREPYPNLFVRGGALYNREHGETTRLPIGWEGQIEAGISIPLFDRNQGAVAAATAEELQAQADLRRLELSLGAQGAVEFARYLTALRSAESYRTEILPRAEQAYALYLARYREMAAAYPQVLVAQRTLFDMSVRYLASIEEAWRSSLRLQGALPGDGLLRVGADPGESPDGNVTGE